VINVTVASPNTRHRRATAPRFVIASQGPSFLVRVTYFVLIGWWLGLVVASLAWVINLTIIGLPLGLYMLNRLPAIITLRPQEQDVRMVGSTIKVGGEQLAFVLRACWFVFIGWWLSLVWIGAAYACVVTIVLLPLAFWMFGRVGAVTTLYRS
jgi:uncharacterized membrane protein YccF (DUF307 family)